MRQRATPAAALGALGCVCWLAALLMTLLQLRAGSEQRLLQVVIAPQSLQSQAAGSVIGITVLLIAGAGLLLAASHVRRLKAFVVGEALQRAEASEAARQHSLARLSMASEQAGISVWELDLKRDLLVPSEGTDLSRRLGVSRCTGTEFVQRFVHPDDREAFMQMYAKHLLKSSNKDRFNHQYRLLHMDGSVRHMEFHARILRDPEGRATSVVGCDWEVTFEIEAAREIRRQDEQLRDAERRLERAFRSSMEGHWDVQMATGQLWMSEALLALYGYGPEFRNVDWAQYTADYLHPDDIKVYKAALAAHLKHGAVYSLRVRFKRSDGTYRWTLLHGAVERDAQGKPHRMAGSSRDIHEQKLAQDELQAMQARFDRAIRGTRDGLFDFDLRTQLLWVSPRMWELLGYEPASMPSELQGLYHYVHPDDVALLRQTLAAHCEQGAPYDIEYRLQRNDGEWLWVRSRATAECDPEGVALRLSGSVHDISEARAAREALISATQDAKAANRAKSTFLATMSHEIRTPMNGLIGMTDLLLDTPLERIQREYVETIRTSSDSLLAIINDVLDFTKIEAGKLEVERIEMNPRATVENVAAMMALPAAAKNVELVVDIDPAVPERVLGDPQRIRQCLSNLLGNAVKFTSTGEIVIELRQRAVDGRVLTYFQVRDTGIGMTAEAASTLFQPFVQADSSTTRKFGGTGLGLSIVKRLVEIMGGQVGLETAVGKGSTFWFFLPLEALPAIESEPAARVEGADRRLLIVDDNATLRQVVTVQLTRAGFACETAANAAEALTCMRAGVAQQRPFEVVLIDRQLPDVDAEQLGEQIGADPQLARSRLVLLTGVDGGGDRKRFEQLGFSAYLTKPLRATELQECLRRVLALQPRDWHMRTGPVTMRSRIVARDTYRGHVLLVEDNIVNQKVAQKFVERLGCSVSIVVDGAEAVAACQRERFDLILMDMEMPVMDGTTATRHIRELEAPLGRRTPIVALTANALSEQVEHCLRVGMDDFLTKPIDAARLREVFARFLQEAASEESAAAAS